MTLPARLYVLDWQNDARSVYDEPFAGAVEYVRADTVVPVRTTADVREFMAGNGPLPSVLASSEPWRPERAYVEPSDQMSGCYAVLPNAETPEQQEREDAFFGTFGLRPSAEAAMEYEARTIKLSREPRSPADVFKNPPGFAAASRCKCRVNWFGVCWKCGAEAT